MVDENKQNNDSEQEHSAQEHQDNSGVDEHLAQMSGEDHHSSSGDSSGDPEKAEIDYGLSAVAQNPKKNIITMVIVVAIVGFLAYYFLFDDQKKPAPVSNTDISISTSKDSDTDVPIPTIPGSTTVAPAAPVAPAIPTAPTAATKTEDTTSTKTSDEPKPPAPPTPSEPSKTNNVPNVQSQYALQQQAASNQKLQQEEKARITSSIMVKQGSSKTDDTTAKVGASNGKFKPTHTASTQLKVTKFGKMSTMIAQGKVIDAVLESSLVSTYPGPVRALITRDVYSEKGENVLIPKGSRMIGTFSSGYTAGQNRVAIQWNRVIMPNGYDLAIDSPTAGPEGIMGVEGKVHTEIAQTLTNAVLVSAINIAFAKISEDLTNTGKYTNTSTVSSSGAQTNTSTTSPTQTAINQQAQNFGNTMQSHFQQNFVVKPFITIQHGTRVKVFVNKDLLFPNNLANGINIIQ